MATAAIMKKWDKLAASDPASRKEMEDVLEATILGGEVRVNMGNSKHPLFVVRQLKPCPLTYAKLMRSFYTKRIAE
jgi:hypothetical protein